MQEILFTIIVYISSMCLAREANIMKEEPPFNHISSHSSSSTHQSDTIKMKDSWHQVSPNNWIIFDTDNSIKKDLTSLEGHHAAAMSSNNHRSQNIFSSPFAQNLLENSNDIDAYAQTKLNLLKQDWHNGRMSISNHFPISYYTFNHTSDGNYMPPTRTDVKFIEPYIVTISKMRTTNVNVNPQTILTRQQSPVTDVPPTTTKYSNTLILPQDMEGNIVSSQRKVIQNIDIRKKLLNGVVNHSMGDDARPWPAKDATVREGNNKTTDDDNGALLHKVFSPLRHTLDSVIYFCDIAKRFISNDDDKDNDNDNDGNDADTNDDDDDDDEEKFENDLNTKKPTTGIQGQRNGSRKPTMLSMLTPTARNLPTLSKETESLNFGGTGRKIKKLKKKLNKLLIPLLLAYKLKFLTLIPVFIGGLILLVGTTGLAGFFFALFTAVMSLKSTGSSKSIVVKKI